MRESDPGLISLGTVSAAAGWDGLGDIRQASPEGNTYRSGSR